VNVTLEQAKNIAEISGVAVAVFTLAKGLYEYTKLAAQKRAEHFIHMRDRYGTFWDICALLEKEKSSVQAKEKLCKLPFERKRSFLGFFEEIALMMQSGLIKKSVAHYMFGYYAILCWSSDAFWDSSDSPLDRKSMYWAGFKTFAQEMSKIQQTSSHASITFKRYRI
jgi:hypothetical protein